MPRRVRSSPSKWGWANNGSAADLPHWFILFIRALQVAHDPTNGLGRVISSCVEAELRNVRHGLPVASGERHISQDQEKVDYRMRSKWSRALRYAAEFKSLDEPLGVFIKRKGGINKCAARYARRLGRGSPHRALGRIAK